MAKKASKKWAQPARTELAPAAIHFDPALEGRKLWFDMIQYRRPYATSTDNMFADALAMYIGESLGLGHTRDLLGNIFVVIGDSPTTAFTAHTDTVHYEEGTQKVVLDTLLDHVMVDDLKSNCLGADDTSGIIILMELMRAGVNGVYCLFRGEEVGGVGSAHAAAELSKSSTHPMNGVTKVVSFDRKGYEDIITNQSWGDCCSTQFATDLATQLNRDGLQYRPDDTGLYTDSAEFMDDISECTNIAVGYDFEHSTSEFQDVGFLFDYLIPAVLKVDWAGLATSRDPVQAAKYAWGGVDNTLYSHSDSPYEFKAGNVGTVAKDSKQPYDYALEMCLDNIKAEEMAAFLELHSITTQQLVDFAYANGVL